MLLYLTFVFKKYPKDRQQYTAAVNAPFDTPAAAADYLELLQKRIVVVDLTLSTKPAKAADYLVMDTGAGKIGNFEEED